MKIFYHCFALLALVTAVSACSTDADTDAALPTGEGNVRFVTRAPQSTATPGPLSVAGEYRILAFRKGDAGFGYYKEIPVAGMGVSGNTLSGTVQLPAGEYKFFPSYGLVTPGNYTWPTFTADLALTNDLFVTHTGESFPAAFMLNQPLDAVSSYTVSLDGPKTTVNATLRRSVSRVDVLFIRADKDATTGRYTEKSGDDVFGPETLAGVKMQYTDANSRLGLSGEKVAGVFDVTHTIASPAAVLTMGTGASTKIGADGYDYENVQPGDIVSGSAHLKGTYLIPNPDNTPTTALALQLTSGEGSERNIVLPDNIPVERNKVTLIRIYVLGENVFTTGVEFAVEVDTAWDGSYYVDGEID